VWYLWGRAGRSFIGQNLAVTSAGVDRQWMETD